MRSPGFSPSSITQSLPNRGPTVTPRWETLFVIHHPHKIVTLQFLDRPLRNKERTDAILNFEPRLRVLARPKDVARVWEKCANPNRARFCIHFPVCCKEAAFVRMHLAIRTDEFADRFALVQGLGQHGRKLLRPGKVLSHSARRLSLSGLLLKRLYRRTRAACSQKITDAEIRVANNAGDGRGDCSKVQVQLCLFKCRPGSLNGCLRP